MRKIIIIISLIFFSLPLYVLALGGVAQDVGGTTYYNFTDGTTGISQDFGNITYYNFTSPSNNGFSGYTCKPVYDDGYKCTTQSDYNEKQEYYKKTARAPEKGSFSSDIYGEQALKKCQDEINDYQKKLKEFSDCETEYNKKFYSNNSTNSNLISPNNNSTCIAKYGENTYYNETAGSCYCSSGYKFDKINNKCITYTEECQNDYGINTYSKKDSDGYRCYCSSGYVLNTSKTKCISGDDFCKSSNPLQTYNIQLKQCENKKPISYTIPKNTTATILNTDDKKIIQQNKIDAVNNREKINLSKIDSELSEKLKGRILLQVENKGEAWYVDPKNRKKYYMANGDEAYRIMRDLGVGITNKNLEKIKNNKNFAIKYSGKIFLQVESLGQAYYIDFDGNSHYLKNGDEAYKIMRNLGLGITNNNLRKVEVGE